MNAKITWWSHSYGHTGWLAGWRGDHLHHPACVWLQLETKGFTPPSTISDCRTEGAKSQMQIHRVSLIMHFDGVLRERWNDLGTSIHDDHLELLNFTHNLLHPPIYNALPNHTTKIPHKITGRLRGNSML
ncbi:hypothetical protein DMENIID0001_139960 [Sergentomyia squamirostris]